MENKKMKVIAFYLPQYYPVKENDEWFGKGYTEWTNVGNAKPLFRGHYQPRVPADLGYYDLRLPKVRSAQAELAKEAGIDAFCYYHYWFGNGKQMLDMPLNEVVKLGEPDFPFCIAWANHTWYKKMWDPTVSVLNKLPLIKQEYPGREDVDNHFYSLLDAFKDRRYYCVNGKRLFVLYRIEDIPDLDYFMKRWQSLAVENGLNGFYFVSYSDDYYRLKNIAHKKCDATILSLNTELNSFGKNIRIRKLSKLLKAFTGQLLRRPSNVFDYKNIITKLANPIYKENKIYPTLLPNWDNTPRRASGSLVLHNSSPELFGEHVSKIFELILNKPDEDQIVFLKSWNEWGEGNYMEPDLKHGKGYINELRRVIEKYS